MPIIPTIMSRVRADAFDVQWARLRGKEGDWDIHTGEIRLHWNLENPIEIFLHEALHDLFPNARERWIWQRTRGAERRLTTRERREIHEYLERARRRQQKLSRGLEVRAGRRQKVH